MTTATVRSNDEIVGFEYELLPISDLHVETRENPKSGKREVSTVLVNDEPLQPSERFWTSLFARYGFNKSFFEYFDHSEVFQRISERKGNDRMRVCIERTIRKDKPRNRLLAVSSPARPIIGHDDLVENLTRHQGRDLVYHDGIVESTHTPTRGGSSFEVAGDKFGNRFVMATPIDGYGTPNIYLALLRFACTNGMIAISKAFRSQLNLGKDSDDVTHTLTRALEGFGSDEGYAALRDRILAASNSWASVYEATELYKSLVKLHHRREIADLGGVRPAPGTDMFDLLTRNSDGQHTPMDDEEQVGSPIIKAFHNLTGDTSRLYGLANLDSISAKRQRTLPVKCTVYDMINFATEVATHYSKPNGARNLQAWVGSLITSEFDMEGTRDKYGDFADFHIERKLESDMTGSKG